MISEYKKRAIEKRDQLQERIVRSIAFIDSDFFESVDESQQDMLREQVKVMSEYLAILNRRLNDIQFL